MRAQNLAPIDTSLKLPPSVQAQADRATAAFNAAKGIKDEPVVAPIVSKEAAVVPPVAPAGTQEAPVVAAPVAAAPVVPPVEAPVTPAVAAPAKDVEWERKYLGMKGRHDVLKEQLARMGEQVSNLQSVIATMQTRPAPAAEAVPATRLVTADEEREYGPDFLNVVGRRAKEEISPEVSALKRDVDSLRAQIGNVGQMSAVQAKAQYFKALDDGLADWRVINNTDEFKDWLRLPDPYSGAIRLQLLKTAAEQNDSPRVLAFFKGFLAEEAATDPVRGETHQTESLSASGKVSLETFAAPGRAKSTAGTPPPVEKPFIKRSDISKFYADVARGAYRGKDAEKAQHEAAIFAAQRDGRLQ